MSDSKGCKDAVSDSDGHSFFLIELGAKQALLMDSPEDWILREAKSGFLSLLRSAKNLRRSRKAYPLENLTCDGAVKGQAWWGRSILSQFALPNQSYVLRVARRFNRKNFLRNSCLSVFMTIGFIFLSIENCSLDFLSIWGDRNTV